MTVPAGHCDRLGGVTEFEDRAQLEDAAEFEHVPEGPVSFRLRPAVGIRMVGFGFVGLGVLVAVALAWRALGLSGAEGFTIAWWVLVALSLALAALGGWLALDPTPRLRLDADGFVNRTGPRVGVRTGRWRDVRAVRQVEVGGESTVMIALADGRHSRIVPRMLSGSSAKMETALQERLNAAHGYRPL